jgi:hypothetical protein
LFALAKSVSREQQKHLYKVKKHFLPSILSIEDLPKTNLSLLIIRSLKKYGLNKQNAKYPFF